MSYQDLKARLAATIERARRIGIDFLHTELDVAASFLDVAMQTRDLHTAQRNIRNTNEALQTVYALMRRMPMNPVERRALLARCGELRARLLASSRELAAASRTRWRYSH